MGQCQGFFEDLVSSQIRNAFATDSQLYQPNHLDSDATTGGMGIFKEEMVVGEVLSLLRQQLPPSFKVPTKVLSSKCIWFNGILYSVNGVHEGNSNVFLKGRESPFTIEKILHVPKLQASPNGAEGDIWLVLHPYQRADVAFDPYRKFPCMRASL